MVTRPGRQAPGDLSRVAQRLAVGVAALVPPFAYALGASSVSLGASGAVAATGAGALSAMAVAAALAVERDRGELLAADAAANDLLAGRYPDGTGCVCAADPPGRDAWDAA